MEVNKNNFYNQEMSTEEKSLKYKFYDYFYYIIINKNKASLFLLFFFHFLEIIQIISFAFSSPHSLTWKMSPKSFQIINIITSSFRIAPLFQFGTFKDYMIALVIFAVIILIFCILLIVQLCYKNTNSKIFNKLLSITHISIAPLTIFLYIPLTELFLYSLKCYENQIIFKTGYFKCWISIHYFLIVIGSIFALLFLIYLLLLNSFYYYPFQKGYTTIKLNSSIDILMLEAKLLLELKYIFIKNEYVSISILLIISIFLLYGQFSNPVYNINLLELFLNLRNILIFWTFFMLLVAQICLNTKINNLIYLLLFGYPIIIFSFIMFYKDNETKFNYRNSSFNTINSCLSRTRFIIKLIDSFIDEHKNNLKYNERENRKNDILLKGFIQIHTETCLKEECPLTKFINNNGNFNVQKQCLLNYMSIYFNNAIKKFPYSIILRLYFIHFNFYKKYNLNSVRGNLEKIKKMKCDSNEEFILYCLEKEILKMNIKEVNDGIEGEKETVILEEKYKRLKDLISNSTKLYVEFWGIFATNITNNLNNSKLYKIGEKLNVYLKEINSLWEYNLKNKKIDVENENNAQLYSRFLKEILWDQKKSEIVLKKINEEHNMNGYNKILEEKPQLQNIDIMQENQDYTIYVNSNDKGKCNIIQFSNSLTYLIGYQKQEMINKPLEFLMPSIFIDGHSKKVEEYIKNYHFQKNSDSFRGVEKKHSFILIKNKIGYLVPFNAKYKIFDDNDFSNSFVIKAKLEPRDSKSMYPYYILTRPDFSVESISSSAIHLGLTMDLLKKYVIKLNILVRNSKDNILNLFDRFKEYEEDTKKVIWVYPDNIYPKNDISRYKDTPIQDLIKISKKKKFNLQIFEMKYNEDEIIGFVFKFTEIKKNKKNKKDIIPQELEPSSKYEIIFDLLNLNYIRTEIVTKKTGLRNLREKEEENENKNILSLNTLEKRRKKKTKENYGLNEVSSDEDKIEVLLTKDKILELQTKDSNGIKTFINSLPFYGNEISLIKHRPNKEQYPCGKAQEPLIKIDLSNYTRRIDARIRENPSFLKKIKNRMKEERNSNDDNTIKTNYISSNIKQNENNKEEEINKDFIGDTSFSLINIFDIKTIKIVKFVDFFIYAFTISITIIEFILSYLFLKDSMNRFYYLSSSYTLLNDLAYTKYFITEAILANIDIINTGKIKKEEFYLFIKEELGNYRQNITEILNSFSSASIDFSDDYKEFISKTNITIKTLSNGMEKDDEQPFASAISKLTTAIFYISTISDNNQINMNNTYAYELMVNLLNGYYIPFEKLIIILLNDFKEKTKNSGIKNIVILFISVFIAIFYLIIFWKMMSKLDNDREKPINLFLTIKKKVFEDLKNSAESFSNKLLNKFFGVDENEEESQQDYKTNIKSNDINIAKFKALNEFKATNNKKNSFKFYFIELTIFYFIFNILALLKYINTRLYYFNIDKFTQVYNSTQLSQIYLMTRVDNIRQYLFNKSIIIYNVKENEMINHFIICFLTLSDQLEDTIKQTSKTDSFLKDDYINSFKKYMYENVSEIVPKDERFSDKYLTYFKKAEIGFKAISLEIFELLRFLNIKYFLEDGKNDTIGNNISKLINDEIWEELNNLFINIVRPWYKNINSLMNESFYNCIQQQIIQSIIIFALVIILISMYYWILWKRYENEFIKSIKKSFELINLIPEEIKNIIVNKLNEQN